jgi:hypothetical protein
MSTLHMLGSLQQTLVSSKSSQMFMHGSGYIHILETTWKQTRNETLKVHEMKQLY